MPEKKENPWDRIADILLVLYICVSFWLLAHESKAETKICFLKAIQIHKLFSLFSLKVLIFSRLLFLTGKKLISSACNNNYICLSLR